MRLNVIAVALAVAAVSLTGCVSKKNYAALQADYSKLQADYQTAQVELAKSNSSNQNLEQRLADARAANAELKRAYAEMQKTLNQSIESGSQSSVNIAKLVDEINASNKYIKELVAAKSKSDSLNMVLTNNLTRSLSRDELKDIDVKVLKGVVYISLADNMLYKSGSYEVSDRAMETLGKIAKIIKDYKDYDVLVEGNTDDVPISRTNIRNNWDLSALRASSVVQVLQNRFGIDPSRLTAGGRGEYNPIADNSSDLGRQRNRRTEIIVTPKLDQFLDLIDHAPDTDEKYPLSDRSRRPWPLDCQRCHGVGRELHDNTPPFEASVVAHDYAAAARDISPTGADSETAPVDRYRRAAPDNRQLRQNRRFLLSAPEHNRKAAAVESHSRRLVKSFDRLGPIHGDRVVGARQHHRQG